MKKQKVDFTHAPEGTTHCYALSSLMHESDEPLHYWQWEKHEDGKDVKFWNTSEWSETPYRGHNVSVSRKEMNQ